MDKRILKTKKALKQALISLLKEKNFDAVRTTEICERALVSRNTFYNYYSDKYALLEDCFADYEENFNRTFEGMQDRNNRKHEVKQGFLNLIDTFFATDDTFHYIPMLSNFDLIELFYRTTMQILEQYEAKYAGYLNPDYDFLQLNSFLVMGFWGFIHGNPKMPRQEVQERTRQLVLDLLQSPVFRTKK